ncbi:MAG: hypothetical protein H6737_16600 [Alphaproteobacteria bacterium]|nr:hypothetical protein [Alphaproteobacteria bacterium]
MSSGTRTVMVLLVHGYDRGTRGTRDETTAFLGRIHAVGAALEAGGGRLAQDARERRTWVFDSATASLRAAGPALEAARAEGLDVSMAIETGDVDVDARGVWGTAAEVVDALIDDVEWGRAWFGAVTMQSADLEGLAWSEVGVFARHIGSGTVTFELGVREPEPEVVFRVSSDVGPDDAEEPDREVAVLGLALPAVPVRDAVAGYAYELLADGRWVVESPRSHLRLRVGPEGVAVEALMPGVTVGGEPVPSGGSVVLSGPVAIRTRDTGHTWRPVDGPWVGVVVADTSEVRIGLPEGGEIQVGREPRFPGLALPDRRASAAMVFADTDAGARARERGFALDRELTGREQCRIVRQEGLVRVESTHPVLPTGVLGDEALQLLQPGTEVQLEDGALLLVGTSAVGLLP